MSSVLASFMVPTLEVILKDEAGFASSISLAELASWAARPPVALPWKQWMPMKIPTPRPTPSAANTPTTSPTTQPTLEEEPVEGAGFGAIVVPGDGAAGDPVLEEGLEEGPGDPVLEEGLEDVGVGVTELASHEVVALSGMSMQFVNCSPELPLLAAAILQVGKLQLGHALETQGKVPSSRHLLKVGDMQLLVVCHHHWTTMRLHEAAEAGTSYAKSKPIPVLAACWGSQHSSAVG